MPSANSKLHFHAADGTRSVPATTMRIFVFEFITGGGWYAIDSVNPPAGSLLAEGRAMADSTVADFLKIPDAKVTTLRDARLDNIVSDNRVAQPIDSEPQLWQSLMELAGQADHTLLIAPEFDGHLLRTAEAVARFGGNLLSPDPEFIRLCSNKQATADLLRESSVPSPRGVLLHPGEIPPVEFTFPAVRKPVDGAGSMDVRLFLSSHDYKEHAPPEAVVRLEEYHPGLAVSVVALCGTADPVFLPPCSQQFSGDGLFRYEGGEAPLEDHLAARAEQLAQRTIAALPKTTGYIGIDMVLGEAANGGDDVVIEVNPRLTTSYVGLRKLVNENLAAAILAAAQCHRVELSIKPGRVEFSADGAVRFEGSAI